MAVVATGTETAPNRAFIRRLFAEDNPDSTKARRSWNYGDELFGEESTGEGREGGGGDVLGGEAEDVSDFVARIELGRLSKLEHCVALDVFIGKGKWVPMDHSKSKKHNGVVVYLTTASNLSKKVRIHVFEHFTHQLVIVFIDPLVTVCIRS